MEQKQTADFEEGKQKMHCVLDAVHSVKPLNPIYNVNTSLSATLCLGNL